MKLRKSVALILSAILLLSLVACTGNRQNEPVATSSATNSSSSPNTGATVSKAFVVESKYYTDRVIVAEVNAAKDYGADPTGKTDSTAAIQSAIDHVAFYLKGGTVYLPVGNYRVEGRIIVRTGVTLIGDYVDPDKAKGTDYGTMLHVYTDKRASNGLSVISMYGGSAIEGITVYYPEQNADNPIDYYYTIDSQNSASSRTVKNVTLLNSYMGIASPIDSITACDTFNNVKGTALKAGLYIYSNADIAYYDKITFSPKYWASMDKAFNPPSEDKVRASMRKSKSCGLYVRDTDRACFSDCTLDGFTYGIYSDEAVRSEWNGSYHNFIIKNAEVGIYSLAASAAYGANFSESSISGSKYAIQNKSVQAAGVVNLYNTKVNGKTEGKIIELTGEKMIRDKYSSNTPLPGSKKIFNAVTGYGADNKANSDSTTAIQKALDDAKASGGGIVYLPGGEYQLDGSLTVYEGTMLLGSYMNCAFIPNYGTMIYAYSKNKELITVNGKNAGIVGLNIAYPENGITKTNYTERVKNDYPYTVKCTAEKTYVTNLCISATSKGVLFENADNFILNRLFMTAWYEGVTVKNSDNGYIYGILANVGFTHGLTNKRFADWLMSGEVQIDNQKVAFQYAKLDYNICYTLTLLTFENSKNIQLIQNFHYGAYNYAKLNNSSLYFENIEAARIIKDGGRFFTLTGNSSVTGVNALCYGNIKPTHSVEAGSKFYIANMDVAGTDNHVATN